VARWLRLAIITIAVLALLVSLYALAAIVYRTAMDRLTPNRLAFIGWNVINIGLLTAILLYQARAKGGDWLHALHRAFSLATVAYAAWTLAVILVTPWLLVLLGASMRCRRRCRPSFSNPDSAEVPDKPTHLLARRWGEALIKHRRRSTPAATSARCKIVSRRPAEHS
jgi:hypothetical protein